MVLKSKDPVTLKVNPQAKAQERANPVKERAKERAKTKVLPLPRVGSLRLSVRLLKTSKETHQILPGDRRERRRLLPRPRPRPSRDLHRPTERPMTAA